MQAQEISVIGAKPDYARAIRRAFASFPAFYFKAARLSRCEVNRSDEMRSLVASYQHGSRVMRIYPGIGNLLLTKALGHELAHGVDDIYGHPHYFSSMDDWTRMHRDQGAFDLPKYRDEPLEYFADVMVKYFMLGRERLRITHPSEVTFLESVVLPRIQDEFGGK